MTDHRSGFDDAFNKGVANPQRALQIFFEFVRVSTVEFRKQYNDKLHWAIRRAIREKALEIMEPYVEKLLRF